MGQGSRQPDDYSDQAYIVVLQYRCRQHSTWTQVGKRVTNLVACDYSPYQLVQCLVKAFNTVRLHHHPSELVAMVGVKCVLVFLF